MAKPCSICESDKRHAIEIALVHGLSYSAVAKRHGLSKDAIGRHARSHLTPQIRAGILAAQAPEGVDVDKLRESEAEGIIAHLVTQRSRLLQVSQLALEHGDARTMVSAEAAIGANLTLAAKLLGQLVQRIDVRHASVLLTPSYLRLRKALLGALRGYPEAARAVANAIAAVEQEEAAEIAAGGGKAPVIEHEPAAPQPVRVLGPPPC